MSEATGATSDPDAGYQGRRAAVRRAARGLANAGHEAVLAAPHRFEGFVRDQGVPSAAIDDCWSVAAEGPGAGADILVDNGQVVVGQHVTEKLGIPAVLALPIPMYVPTREFPWAGRAIPRWWPPRR
jgi:sterol 3beta-glucosyltransferase